MQGAVFWNLWQTEWLYSELVDFDGIAKKIYVHPDVTELSVRSDIYSAWKRWVQLHKNSGFKQALRVVGGDPVGAGEYAGDIYFLMNGWQIVIDHPIKIDGILYHDDEISLGTSPYDIRSGGGVIAKVSSLTQLVEVGGGSGGSSAADIWGMLATSLTTPGSIGATMRDMAISVESTKANLVAARTDIGQVNTKVTALDVSVTAVDDKVTDIDGRVTAVDGKLTVVDDKVDTLSTDVASVQTLVEGSDGKLDELVTATEALQTDVTSVLGNLATATELINTLLKYERNRTRVDQTAKTLTVFDDDGVTPLKVFNLKNFLGAPSVTEVAERSPI